MMIELFVVARPWNWTLMHESTNVVNAKAQRPSGAGLAKRRW